MMPTPWVAEFCAFRSLKSDNESEKCLFWKGKNKSSQVSESCAHVTGIGWCEKLNGTGVRPTWRILWSSVFFSPCHHSHCLAAAFLRHCHPLSSLEWETQTCLRWWGPFWPGQELQHISPAKVTIQCFSSSNYLSITYDNLMKGTQ